jgi:hypothetical protein
MKNEFPSGSRLPNSGFPAHFFETCGSQKLSIVLAVARWPSASYRFNVRFR